MHSNTNTPILLVSSRRSEFPAVYDISTEENRRRAFTNAVIDFFGPDGFDFFPSDDAHLDEAYDEDQREELEFITPHFRRLEAAARSKTESAAELNAPNNSNICLAEWILGSQEQFDTDMRVLIHEGTTTEAPAI